MAIRFVDGFEHYGDTPGTGALTDAGWHDFVDSFITVTCQPSDQYGGRTGTYALYLGGANNSRTGTLRYLYAPASNVMVQGFGWRTPQEDAQFKGIWAFWYNNGLDAINWQFGLCRTTENGLVLVRGDAGGVRSGMMTNNYTAILGQTGPNVVRLNAWEYIELHVTTPSAAGGTDGAVIVRVNGKEVLNLTGLDLDPAASGIINMAGPISYCANRVELYDDVYFADGSGTTNNNFLGDVRMRLLTPNGAGTYAEWSPTGDVTNWECVDDGTAGPDGDTTYNATGTAGSKDSFAFTDVPAEVTEVLAVQVITSARKEDAGEADISNMAKLGTDESFGSIALSTNYQHNHSVFETKPGGGAWTPVDVNNAEFGYRAD